MKELGQDSEKLHKEIGKLVGEIADSVFFVGEMAKIYEKGFKSKEKNKKCQTFSSVEEFLENFSLEHFLKKPKKK